MMFKKKNSMNEHNGYNYVGIQYEDGLKSRRVHVLVAKAHIENPNNHRIVGHKHNNKSSCDYRDLYWTTTQENTKRAIEDGLATQDMAEFNENSIKLKVIDNSTNEVCGVYGSIRQCCKCIENVKPAFISRVHNKQYKSRSKKYIYQSITDEEFEKYSHLKDVKLVENPPVDKSPKVFYLINEDLGYKEKFDNQKSASKVCGIQQSTISSMIRDNTKKINGWRCEFVKAINYTDASSYDKMIELYANKITIQDINTKEELQFNSSSELSKFLGIKGHSINDYYKNDHLLMDRWKIISMT